MVTIPWVHFYAGRILGATPGLTDPSFFRTVVLLLHHDEKGAVGVVLNRPTAELVVDYFEPWAHLVGDPPVIYSGGPVEPEIAVALVAGDVGDPTGLGGVSLGDVSADPTPASGPARIFSGYSGWDSGQLEAEIEEGAWYVLDADPDDVFGEPTGLWGRVLRRQGGLLALMHTFPADVTLN